MYKLIHTIVMKFCNKCKNSKEFNKFSKNRSNKDGLQDYCKKCTAVYSKEWVKNNPEKHLKAVLKWQKENPEKRKINQDKANKKRRLLNPEKCRLQNRISREKHRDKRNLQTSIWQKNNLEKGRIRRNRYNERKRTATPKWVTKEQKYMFVKAKMLAQKLTLETGIKYETDHIIPISGELISGLHVPWNIQVITSTYNKKKYNKI